MENDLKTSEVLTTEDAAVGTGQAKENVDYVVSEEYNEITFVTKTGDSDVTFKVEGHKIPVVKAVLSIASPVFAAMFESKFKEKEQSEIELPGKRFKDFVEFLSCLYPDKLEPVTRKNMYRILEYACEYQVEVLEKRCRKMIYEEFTKKHRDNEVEIYRHLQLAELYSLDELKKKAVEVASELSVEKMQSGITKYPVSDKNNMEIQTMALERHELNRADDEYVLQHRSKYTNSKVYSAVLGSDLINDQIEQMKSCADILRGLRLCYRYFPSNSEKRKTLLSKLCEQETIDIANCRKQIELLPESLKQSLSEVCHTQKCSKFSDVLEC